MESTPKPTPAQQAPKDQNTAGDAKKPRNRNRNRKPRNPNQQEESKDEPRAQTAPAQKQRDNRQRRPRNEPKSTQQVRPSTETGFTGPTADWFDNKEFEKAQGIDLSRKDHDYYYGSYSSFHIHEEMLKDTVRTRAYQRAIEDNPKDFKDKIVLDIGCGTGILSIFAARAGAKHVYAIENAEIALYAEEIIKRNNLSDKITVIKGKMEEITLPVKQVDIIISEWMGYFLLYESMLDSVLWARDKYLVKGGKMLPDRATVYLAALEDGEYKGQKREFWNDVYGVNMSCLTPTVMREPLVDVCHQDMVMSSSCKVLELNLCTMQPGEVEFSSEYLLRCNYNDKVHGLIGYWDCEFADLEHPVTLSTSPFKRATHWKQTVFYLEHDLEVKKGDVISGSICMRKSLANFREQDIKISYHINTDTVKRDFVNMYKLR